MEFRLTRSLKIEGKDQRGDWIYYTDGRGESNASMMTAGDIKSKIKWEGAKLVSKASVTREVQGGVQIKMDLVEKWELSSDGKNLTDTLIITSYNGTREVKQVYTRAP